MLTIRQIYQTNYQMGKQVYYKYTSKKYYHIDIETNNNGWSFTLTEKTFDTPFEKNLKEKIFEPHKEGSEFYLCEMNGASNYSSNPVNIEY